MNQEREPKIYVNGKIIQISERLLKVNVPVADFIKLIEEHQSNGWISFGISPRQSVGSKGQTHTMWVDKWKPDASRRAQAQAAKPTPVADKQDGDDSSVPF